MRSNSKVCPVALSTATVYASDPAMPGVRSSNGSNAVLNLPGL